MWFGEDFFRIRNHYVALFSTSWMDLHIFLILSPGHLDQQSPQFLNVYNLNRRTYSVP